MNDLQNRDSHGTALEMPGCGKVDCIGLRSPDVKPCRGHGKGNADVDGSFHARYRESSAVRLRSARPRCPPPFRAGADVAAVHVLRLRNAWLGPERRAGAARRAQWPPARGADADRARAPRRLITASHGT